MSIELLQELGLNKYEAEAYYTLVAQGPLTGYELGKRSQVPLSRSYDVLERLSQKGLVLAQPGDPARYKALEPALFLNRVRSTMEHTLDTLASTLNNVNQSGNASDFWVVRGRQHILARARTLCAMATSTLQLALPQTYISELAPVLDEARQRGCHVTLATSTPPGTSSVSLLVDAREALLGTLEPGESCQATLSANPALIAVLTSYFHNPQARPDSLPRENEQPDWLEWEKRKQQRLQKARTDQRIA
ncbi:MAG TPA: helix-turn-helix domain-containing protein [Ktedonobacteraceae bacterium]|nr:helix-turn-helix domain-containing protein [Ktedonobacteraceae bacterium]